MEKNILFIIPSLSHGGAENQTVQQCNALYERGWKVYLCILTSNVPLLDRIKLPKTQILILSAKSEILNFKSAFVSASDIKQLYKFVSTHKVSRVIANLPLGHWYGRILKLLKRDIKLYNYHRSLQYDANPLDTLPKRLFNSVQSFLAIFTDNTSICISEAVKANIGAQFNLKNPVVIYNSVQDKYFELANAKPVRDTHEKLTIVVPGRLHPSKGHLFFLSTLRKLNNPLRSQLRIILAGGGKLEQEIKERIAAFQLEDLVEVTGALENKVLLQTIFEADLVLIPSIHEGLGNVAIESLMLGKTMIVSDAGGLKEIVQHKTNGYVFQTGNEKELLDLLIQVVCDYPQSIISFDVLRKSFHNRFSFESHLNSLISVIEKKR